MAGRVCCHRETEEPDPKGNYIATHFFEFGSGCAAFASPISSGVAVTGNPETESVEGYIAGISKPNLPTAVAVAGHPGILGAFPRPGVLDVATVQPNELKRPLSNSFGRENFSSKTRIMPMSIPGR